MLIFKTRVPTGRARGFQPPARPAVAGLRFERCGIPQVQENRIGGSNHCVFEESPSHRAARGRAVGGRPGPSCPFALCRPVLPRSGPPFPVPDARCSLAARLGESSLIFHLTASFGSHAASLPGT